MSQPVNIFDPTGQSIRLRLTADLEQILGVSGELTVKNVAVQGGSLLIDYQTNANTLTRYLIAPSGVRYVRQDVTVSTPPPPPAQG